MKLKRIFNLLIVFIFSLFIINAFSVKASLVPLKINGSNINYRGTSINVMIPDKYIKPEADFRGVWVTPIVGGNLARFTSEYQYKQEITNVLDIMEHYNLNALIFHVRPFNDAFYSSKLNPWSEYLKGYNVDPGWDPLPWIIEETHKRGIEFHAWLNPYRVNPKHVNNIPSYNIASKSENLLVSKSGSVILNPGEPAVRQFLIDTVMEIVENYDVDAIHFDDYFYIGDIDDSHTMNKPGYNPKGLSVYNWRREQVNIFIQNLSNSIRQYNLENNRVVQLGISPTGIYKNGGSGFAEGGPAKYDANGNFITNGSNTAGQEHYQSYLYADTKKWVDEEWIDYIIPQTYWAFTHNIAGYADVVDWWAKVVRNKKVNLYTGMGIYMADGSGNFSWGTNELEAPMQVLYNTKHDMVKGTSIFSFTQLKKAYNNNANSRITTGFETIRTEYWTTPSLMPEIRTYDRIVLNKVSDLETRTFDYNHELSWQPHPEATKYAIYRSLTNNFKNEDLIAVIGNDEINNRVTYIDKEMGYVDYYYKVVPMSRTNTLGEATVVKTTSNEVADIGEIYNVRIPGEFYPGDDFTLLFDKLVGKDNVKYSVYVSNDLTEWEIIDKQLIDKGTYFSMDISLEKTTDRVFLQVKAENNEGVSTKIIEVPYSRIPDIPAINQVYTKGESAPGLTIEVFWDAFINSYYKDIRYEVELSKDGINYYKANDSYEINRNRVYSNVILPNQKNVYIRVIIINEKTNERIIGNKSEIKLKELTFPIYLQGIFDVHNNRIKNILS